MAKKKKKKKALTASIPARFNIGFSVTGFEKKRLQQLADKFSNGNVSKFIRDQLALG